MPPGAPVSSAEAVDLLAFILAAAEIGRIDGAARRSGPAGRDHVRARETVGAIVKVVKIAGSYVAVLAVIAAASSTMGVAIDAGQAAGGPGAQGGRGRNGGPTAPAPRRAEHRVAHVWRQSRQPSLFTRRPDHEGQLQQARDRVAAEDRFLGPRPDTLYSATPLVVDRVMHTTAGMRRAVIALNAATGEMLWMHTEDEGVRGQNSPRQGAGRGVAYWPAAPIAASSTSRRAIG